MRWAMAVLIAITAAGVRADGLQDNIPDKVRPVPPSGIEVPAGDRAELESGIAALGQEIDSLRARLKGKPLLELLPDVQIYHNAVRYALTYNEFFNAREIPVAKQLIAQGIERARQLTAGQ